MMSTGTYNYKNLSVKDFIKRWRLLECGCRVYDMEMGRLLFDGRFEGAEELERYMNCEVAKGVVTGDEDEIAWAEIYISPAIA